MSVVAETPTTMRESVTATPDADGGFSVLVPGQPDHIYRLPPWSAGMAGPAVEITADAGGGTAIDVTPVRETNSDAGGSETP